MTNWCIPPIRWLQKCFVPPKSEDWQRIAFQPMLMLFWWLGALVVVASGDLQSTPAVFQDSQTGVFYAWGGLSLACPPLALVSLWLIQSRSWKYEGCWLRLGADVGTSTAMGVYLALRLTVGDYHIMPVACLAAALLFMFHLVLRDVKRVRALEKLATKIHWDGR